MNKELERLLTRSWACAGPRCSVLTSLQLAEGSPQQGSAEYSMPAIMTQKVQLTFRPASS